MFGILEWTVIDQHIFTCGAARRRRLLSHTLELFNVKS